MPEPVRPATQARRTDLAARLVDAAEAQIAASGLSELRARGLAERARCSVGAIYGAVPDLDELVLAVNARTLAAIEGAITAGLEAPGPHDVMAGLDPAAGQLVHLADAYLAYAAANRPRWTALFQHRMAERPLPGWYAARRRAAFAPVEAPLARLRPDLPPEALATLAGSLLAAVHGMVALGLDELLGPTPLPALRNQVRVMVTAMAAGLAQPPSAASRVAAP